MTHPTTREAMKRRLREIPVELQAIWREKAALGEREQALRDEQARLNAQVYGHAR